MLSHRFAVSIRPDRVLDGCIRLASVAATLCGLLIVLTLPAPLLLRIALAGAWLASGLHDFCRCHVGQARYREVRYAGDGQWRGLCRNGIWQPLSLAAGTRVGARLVWLRFASDNNRRGAFALRQQSMRSEDWRRLQVILRCDRR